MRRPSKRLWAILAAVDLAALALVGCSSGGLNTLSPGPLPYQYSNAIMPQGFSESVIGPDRYRIEVKGPLTTPRDRLEKIATTRAAEIGKENRLGYFKIDGMQQTTHCQKYVVGGDRGGAGRQEKKLAYTMLTAEVSYAKSPPDPGYVEAKSTFDQYRAALDADTGSAPGPIDPVATAQCG